MGNPPLRIEILPRIDDVDFDTAWERRLEIRIDPESGLIVPFLSKVDLIATKLASGRAQDLADVQAIRAAESST